MTTPDPEHRYSKKPFAALAHISHTEISRIEKEEGVKVKKGPRAYYFLSDIPIYVALNEKRKAARTVLRKAAIAARGPKEPKEPKVKLTRRSKKGAGSRELKARDADDRRREFNLMHGI